MSFQGSPESSVKARGGFISVQFYKNVSNDLGSSSASPKYVAFTHCTYKCTCIIDG